MTLSVESAQASLAPEERRRLARIAQVLEMVGEANPSETRALPALRDIYSWLGDEEKLAALLARLGDSPGATAAPAPALAQILGSFRRIDPPSVVPTEPPAPPAPRENGVAVGPDMAVAPPNSVAPAVPREALPPVAEVQAGHPPAPASSPDRSSSPAEPPPRPASRVGRAGKLGDLLVSAGLISTEQLDEGLRAQKGSREKIGAVLVRLGFLSEDQLATFLSRQYGIPSITLSQLDIDTEVLDLVPVQMARKYEVLPIKRTGNSLTLAMADPTNVFAVDDVEFMTNLQVVPVVAAQGAIRRTMDRLYESQVSGIAQVISEMEALQGDVEVVEGEEDTWSKADIFELKESADEAPVIRLMNMIFVDAIRRGASDIHLEPYEKVFRVRFRMDGVLHEIMTPPKRLEAALTSRVKIMANLDIAERRLPQDGRIKLRYNQREIDLRVSTLPTIFGEKAVMRVLDKEALQLDLGLLGFDAWSLEHFQKAIRQPYGMILITGPTGSGKTTTLYSAIHTINSPDVNIMTAEDPVEYNLKGVNQLQVKDEIGRTFAAALRSFLRQDPDIILVGETRDLETAQIGIRAALTGHLVLTTLHTNDCPSTVARLLDMGIPPFLVSSSLTLVLAQRLGRKVCNDCKQPYEADEDSLVPYGHVPQGLGRVLFYKGKGCPTCNFTGMKGRVAIYEVMPITDEIRGLILGNAPVTEIREVALAQGMRTLRRNGLQKALDGVTTVEEVLRVTLLS